jgi:hypothetical protein
MWFRVDAGMPEHPKILRVGGDAGWLHLCCMAYACRVSTGGFVPVEVLHRVSDRRNPQRLAEILVDAGLWEPAAGGWQIHDWDSYQVGASDQEERRQARRAAALAANHKRWHVDRSEADPDCPDCIRSDSDRIPFGDPIGIQRHDTTRHDTKQAFKSSDRQTDSRGVDEVGPSVSRNDQRTNDDGIGDLVDLAVAVAASRATGVRNLARWRTGTRRNVLAEHGDALRARRAEHPDETARAAVAAVLGIASTEVWRAEQQTRGGYA